MGVLQACALRPHFFSNLEDNMLGLPLILSQLEIVRF